jgi:hypothetical protein
LIGLSDPDPQFRITGNGSDVTNPKKYLQIKSIGFVAAFRVCLKKEKKLVQNEKILNFRFSSGCLLRVLNPIIRMECSEHIYTNRLVSVLVREARKNLKVKVKKRKNFMRNFWRICRKKLKFCSTKINQFEYLSVHR